MQRGDFNRAARCVTRKTGIGSRKDGLEQTPYLSQSFRDPPP